MALSDYFDLNTEFTGHIANGLKSILNHLPVALFDLLVGIITIQLLVRLARLLFRLSNIQPGLRDVLSSVLETVMWIFLVMTLLNELGFSGVIYFFTGSVAAIGIAMAAGGSTLIADIIAGIFLARDTDFNIGDEVIVGDRPTWGVIESMDARRTRLRDENGILHVIPNSVVERREWVLIRKRPETGALVLAAKAARRLTAVARQKRTTLQNPPRKVRKNNQQP